MNAYTIGQQNTTKIQLLSSTLNRHGLIAGATGTGKTVTLQKIIEELSLDGIPVFVADVKGDLAGIAKPGGGNPKVEERRTQLKIITPYQAFPVTFWDVFGVSGHPIRASVSEMGPLLLGRLLQLNETQIGVLHAAFEIADDQGLLLLDLNDLQALLQYVGDSAGQFSTTYGNISKATIGTIQRGLIELERQGGEQFFGEPAIHIFDFIQRGTEGKGMVNILAAEKLFTHPKTYATFLLWLLSELFEQLPEVGDLDKPKLVFFFDEAHLLFDDAPKALIEKIEQVVRLIRSKGIGIFFITQNPIDIPDTIAAQLGNRVQHALRAYTERDLKAVRASAETFRTNPTLDVKTVITQLQTGEALLSFLDRKGAPGIVERAFIIPPLSSIGTIDAATRNNIIRQSFLYGRYDTAIDRESAYEKLKVVTEEKLAQKQAVLNEKERIKAEKEAARTKKGTPQGLLESMAKSAMRSATTSLTRQITNQIGRQIIRGILGSLTKGK